MVMLKGISTMTIIQQDYRELLSRLKVVGRQKKSNWQKLISLMILREDLTAGKGFGIGLMIST